ncbi:MAG: helix-hairpin-helix domain-containing protein [Turneriella sp.]|nr:helix-hairpin-helix domain-containing protein [Turneriella sp.]
MKKIGFTLLALAFILVPVALVSAKDTAKETKKKAEVALVDINSASAADLQKLKGVGPAISAKIIAGRPYKGKDDLVKKKILSKPAYNAIKDKIVAKQ